MKTTVSKLASSLDRAMIAIAKGKYDLAMRAICEAQRDLGYGTAMLEKLESLTPIAQSDASLVFKKTDLILAGVDVNKWRLDASRT